MLARARLVGVCLLCTTAFYANPIELNFPCLVPTIEWRMTLRRWGLTVAELNRLVAHPRHGFTR